VTTIDKTSVTLRSHNGQEVVCALEYSRGPPSTMRLDFGQYGTRAFTGDNLFDCLVLLRHALEKDGYLPLCNGARLDTYPSHMGLEMGGGRSVYVLTMGRPASLADLVDILGATDATRVGTVTQQRSNYLKWLDSLKTDHQ
jgi:hypothetical protein